MNFKKLATISLFALIFTNSFAEGGDPAKGKALSAICAACHNADGNSINPIWPKLAGQHGAYIVKQLQDFKEGKRVNAQMSGMVATLSNEDMPDLGAYYASQKTKQGSAKPELIDLGQNIYRSGDSQAGIPAYLGFKASPGNRRRIKRPQGNGEMEKGSSQNRGTFGRCDSQGQQNVCSVAIPHRPGRTFRDINRLPELLVRFEPGIAFALPGLYQAEERRDRGAVRS